MLRFKRQMHGLDRIYGVLKVMCWCMSTASHKLLEVSMCQVWKPQQPRGRKDGWSWKLDVCRLMPGVQGRKGLRGPRKVRQGLGAKSRQALVSQSLDEANLGPTCSPERIDLCDDRQQKLLEETGSP